MNRKFLFLTGLLFLLNLQAQNIMQHKLSDVVISAGRTPVTFSDAARNITVLDSTMLSRLNVSSVADVLKYISSVDVRQRGTDGIQTDISVRGGTFDQTLIVIDGVKVNDPQTGHHNMNIPVVIENIERIEILKGQGTRIFGANAFSGVVNIITKKADTKRINISLNTAQNSTYSASILGQLPAGIFENSVSASYARSNGYKHNTGYNTWNLTGKTAINAENINFVLSGGYNYKEFGANSFYGVAYPNQWEKTNTKFVTLAGNYWINNFTLNTKAYFREHNDEYLLDFMRPSFYKNTHETYVKGIELQAGIQTGAGITSIGGEISEDKIRSSNLGNHTREKYGMFLEHQLIIDSFSLNAGFYAYKYAEIGWKYWPGFDLSYKLSHNVKVFGSFGKAFRLPTFTDLFYKSPTINGNPLLNHEETTNYEIGTSYSNASLTFNLTGFIKDGKNIIDWIRSGNSNKWIAENIADIQTKGIETSFDLNLPVLFDQNVFTNLSFSYTWLDADKNIGEKESRYLLEHLRHQATLILTNKLPLDIIQNTALRYEDRVNYSKNFNIDLNLRRNIENLVLTFSINNLLNTTQTDFAGLPLRGRWFSAGINIEIK